MDTRTTPHLCKDEVRHISTARWTSNHVAKIVVYEAAAASGADAAVDDLRTVADSTGEWRCLCMYTFGGGICMLWCVMD